MSKSAEIKEYASGSIEEISEDEIWACIDMCSTVLDKTGDTAKSIGDLIYRTLLGLDSKLESTRQTMTKFVQWAATCNVQSPEWQIAESCASGLMVNSEFIQIAGCDQMRCLLYLDSLGLPEHVVAFQAMSWCAGNGTKGTKSELDRAGVLFAVRWGRIFAPYIGHILDASIKLGVPLDEIHPEALRKMCLVSRKLGLEDFKYPTGISRARHDQDKNIIPAWFPHVGINVGNLKIETGPGFLCKDGVRKFKVLVNTGGVQFVLVGPQPQLFSTIKSSSSDPLYALSGIEVDVFIVDGTKDEATFDFKAREIVIETTWRGNYSVGCFGCEPCW